MKGTHQNLTSEWTGKGVKRLPGAEVRHIQSVKSAAMEAAVKSVSAWRQHLIDIGAIIPAPTAGTPVSKTD